MPSSSLSGLLYKANQAYHASKVFKAAPFVASSSLTGLLPTKVPVVFSLSHPSDWLPQAAAEEDSIDVDDEIKVSSKPVRVSSR